MWREPRQRNLGYAWRYRGDFIKPRRLWMSWKFVHLQVSHIKILHLYITYLRIYIFQQFLKYFSPTVRQFYCCSVIIQFILFFSLWKKTFVLKYFFNINKLLAIVAIRNFGTPIVENNISHWRLSDSRTKYNYEFWRSCFLPTSAFAWIIVK